MPSRQHSLSRNNSGFVHLPDGGSRNNMPDEDVIQLTTVRSNASTGARKPAMAATSSFETAPSEKSKSHLHFHRGRRQKPKDQSLGRKNTGDSENEPASLNFMGRLYYKIIGFSIVSRYLVYIVPVAIFLAIPLIILPLTDTMGDPTVGKGGPPLFQFFLWVEITWCTVWLAKLVAWFLPKLFMFFCGIVSSGTRKYATVLSNLSIPLSLFFWALAVWLTFKHLLNMRYTANWLRTMDTIFGALFVSSAVFLGEKAIVQLIGVSYHQRSFANRIKESKRDVHLIGLLYDASRTLFPMYCQEFAEEDYVINDTIEAMLGKKSGSATPMRLIGDVSRIGGKVTSAFGNIASEITGKNVFNPNSSHSVVIEALEKLRSSEALARRIWMSFVVEGNEELYLEDVAEVLGPAYKVEAEEAFNAIDSDQNGDISLDEMIRKVVEVGKERKAIAEGMKDIGQALGAFDQVLLFVVLLIVIFIFLAFFRSSAIEVIASAGTTLLSLSFIFAVTCQEFLGSCIFLFVKHPYDVGDRVYINDIQLVVERISLLYSVFTRCDTKQVTQIPNIQLNNYWVDNISRSKAMYESIEVDVSYDTTFEDIELLRLEMEKFVRSHDNSRDFQPDFNIGIGGVGSLDKLTLKISILHKSNWHNDMVRASRRSKFMCALALALKKIPIYGPGGGADALGGPANPTYSVAVSDEWASKARDDSAKAKDEGRLVPAAAAQHPGSEEAAIADINNRPPVPEMAAAGQWDNRTLGSDEGQRTRDIESMRSDLLKRASTRGRRKAGEGIPSYASGLNETAHSPVSPTHSRHELFDEEAQVGSSSSLHPRDSRRSARSVRGNVGFTQTQTQGGSSLYPPGAQSGPPPPPVGQR